MAIGGHIRIEFTLPQGVEFVSLHTKHDGGWAICLKAAYSVLDARGSSLGSCYGSGEDRTIEAAFNAALRKLYDRLREARDRPINPQPTLAGTKTTRNRAGSDRAAEGLHSKSLSADDIFKTITTKKES